MVVALAEESAGELCRMFEYQLSLINEPVALRMLAKYSVDCVYDVMKRRQRLLDRNTVVQGAVKGRPRDSKHTGRQLISIIIGSKELKWNIFDIFKKPGLRKDMFYGSSAGGDRRHVTASASTDIDSVPLRSISRNGICPGSSREDFAHSASRDSGSGFASREELRPAPWRFFTSSHSEPMVYGYRGQMVEWDFVNGHYKLNTDDEMCFSEEVCLRYDDFHRIYCPYMWLIGLDILLEYRAMVAPPARILSSANVSDAPAATPPTLMQFVKQSRGGVYYIRDEIKLVFKPLGVINKSDVSIAAGVNEMALVSDAATEIARACDALRCKLEEIDEARAEDGDPFTETSSRGTNGCVLIHVTCPDGNTKPPGEY